MRTSCGSPRGVSAGVIVLALVTAVVHRPAAAQATAQLQAAAETLAVLGFTNLSGDPAVEWIGPGITETVGGDLSSLGVALVPRPAVEEMVARWYGLDGDRDQAAADIGAALGARWVVSGSYQRLGARLRITAYLIDLSSGGAPHTIRVEGPRDGLFDLQDEVVEQLAAQLSNVSAVTTDRLLSPAETGGPVPETGEPAPSVTPLPGELGESSVVIDGPPPPIAPETITRDAAGRATIRAVRLVEGLTVDGALEEPVYRTVPAISDFTQTEPNAGEPASEKTDAWVFFDDDSVYVSVRCWESAPESEWIVNEMRRDSVDIVQNAMVVFLLDTFYDRRNGIIFNINPAGGRMDGQITNESGYNPDWNPIWNLQMGRFDGGWSFEAAIPFKSLRYRQGRNQVWGFQMHRSVRRKNELAYLTRMEPGLGRSAIFLVSQAATMVGLEVPESGRLFEVKPYLIGDLTSDRSASPIVSNQPGGNLGLDLVKYGVTQNLTADLTVNTDFAQVEADEQQVNLTRFSLFFPEKREFFLENQGLFAFGGAGTRGGGTTPILFYSRQIGLNQGQEVPIDVGGRLTGRVGAFSVGVLDIQTDDAPEAAAVSTNFSVVRIKRDVLRRSSIGALFARRSVSTRALGSNETYGLDGTFAFYDNLTIDTYWAQTATSGLQEDDLSYRTQLDYVGDRYGVQVERLVVGDNFNPEVGFLRRDDFERSFGSFRFSPRPRALAAVRKFSWEGRFDYITDRAGVLETRETQGQFGIEFENSDLFNATYTRSYEFLEQPFPIASDVTIPVGGYEFQDVQASFAFGQQRRLSGTFSAQHGSFFSGEKSSLSYSGRLELMPQLSMQPSLSFNRVALQEGRFSTQLVTVRTTYTMTPLMFVSGLVQYNSSNNSLSTNIRLRWEYGPGSELFVVYNEDRDTDPFIPDRTTELRNRAFVVKVNRLFRF